MNNVETDTNSSEEANNDDRMENGTIEQPILLKENETSVLDVEK